MCGADEKLTAFLELKGRLYHLLSEQSEPIAVTNCQWFLRNRQRLAFSNFSLMLNIVDFIPNV